MGTLVVLAVAVAAAVVSWSVLRHLYGGQGAQVQLDVIRTAGTLVIGTGGAVALLLTARRQRYTELTLVHTDRDATERRITELYTKAADQLGSEKAPVRLAGLHALERLAQNTPEQRQTIVDVICAYLRMPHKPPEEQPPAEDAPAEAHTRYENRRQEQQVRLSAQNILSRNLRINDQHRRRWWHRTPASAIPAWPGIRVDFTEALLIEFSLRNCQLDYASFTHTQFIGRADFECVQFTGGADFRRAQFTGGANFMDARFTGGADFWRTRFTGGTDFSGTQFTDEANFEGVRFTGGTDFGSVRFTDGANFPVAQFTDQVEFWGAQFNGAISFGHARFTDEADFEGAQFTAPVFFFDTQFTDRVNFGAGWMLGEATRVTSTAASDSVWPPGWTTRHAKPDSGEDPAFRYLTKVEDGNPSDT